MVPDAALSASVPLLGSGHPTALVTAWYAGAVLCCAVVGLVCRCCAVLCRGQLGTPVLCRVVLSAWYAGIVSCCAVVGLVRRCCAVLCCGQLGTPVLCCAAWCPSCSRGVPFLLLCLLCFRVCPLFPPPFWSQPFHGSGVWCASPIALPAGECGVCPLAPPSSPSLPLVVGVCGGCPSFVQLMVGACGLCGRGVLNGKEKKSVPVPVFPKKPTGTPCAQPWLVAVGGWRLAVVGGW